MPNTLTGLNRPHFNKTQVSTSPPTSPTPLPLPTYEVPHSLRSLQERSITTISGITENEEKWTGQLDSVTVVRDPSNRPRLDQAWTELNIRTEEDLSVPRQCFYPSDYGQAPSCKYLTPICHPETGAAWNICGNWIINPHDETQKIAVFQYPNPDDVFSYWDLFQELRMAVIDLTDEQDLTTILRENEPFRMYPPADGYLHDLVHTSSSGKRKFTIKCQMDNNCTEQDDIQHKLYSIQNQKNVNRISVLNYKIWSDGTALEIENLDLLANLVSTSDMTVGIHCRGGVGRTGTLVTAAFIKRLITNGAVTKETFTLNWLNDLILSLRRQRSKDWVQTYEQYASLYEYGLSLLQEKTTMK